MTVAEALRDATSRLAKTSDTARLDAELLMAAALGTSRSELLIRMVNSASPKEFEELLERRLSHEPVAYIVGAQSFFGRNFAVRPDVLIPRPDSETVVEALLEAMGSANSGRILDLGTGSGALLLTVLAEREGLIGVGVDRSLGALKVAQMNAEALALTERCKFERWDWHSSQNGDDWSYSLGSFDFVVANPPYVETDAHLEADVSAYEPAEALFAGNDGLADYRVIVPKLASLGAKVCVLEIGATQAAPVSALAAASGFAVEVRNDLANRPRAVVLRP